MDLRDAYQAKWNEALEKVLQEESLEAARRAAEAGGFDELEEPDSKMTVVQDRRDPDYGGGDAGWQAAPARRGPETLHQRFSP